MSYYTKLSNGIIEAHCIDGKTTEDAVHMLRNLIRVGVIVPELYDLAVIDYDCSKGLEFDPNNDKHYALKFHGIENKVMVYPVTAGYSGIGPTACYECLKLMGFVRGEFMEEHPEIFRKRVYSVNGVKKEDPKIHLEYYK